MCDSILLGGQIPGRQFTQTGLVGRAFDLAGFRLLAVVFALFDRLAIVAWGAAFGSYVVAALLMWAASQVKLNRIEPGDQVTERIGS